MSAHTADVMLLGPAASLAAGLGTGVGAAGVFAIRHLSRPVEDALLSSAAGIMLAASFFSLLLPGLEYGLGVYGGEVGAVLVVAAGLALGALTLAAVHRYVPHEHFILGRAGPQDTRLERIWLFIIAITLHNFPEGMAVGVGFAGGDVGNGLALAAGIGLQNMPEGLAVAVSMVAVGYTSRAAFGVGLLTGLVEPVGGVVGAGAVTLAEPLMPWVLGFAAGAMLFVISDEIIPETHRGALKTLATFALLGGFCVMMVLDTTLG